MREMESHHTKESLKDLTDEEIESNIDLLGVTGLEDLLQDDVNQCITDFRDARIKVWMLTGDKAETAFSIGISCGLIDMSKHKICKIKEIKFEALKSEMLKLTQIVEKEKAYNKTKKNKRNNKENHMKQKKIKTAPTMTQDYEMMTLNSPAKVQ